MRWLNARRSLGGSEGLNGSAQSTHSASIDPHHPLPGPVPVPDRCGTAAESAAPGVRWLNARRSLGSSEGLNRSAQRTHFVVMPMVFIHCNIAILSKYLTLCSPILVLMRSLRVHPSDPPLVASQPT